MPKDIYRLEGSALDVLFNYLEQDKPVPHVISKRALSQWKQYLASEGAMSLEESFLVREHQVLPRLRLGINLTASFI